jgi:hypothetical protein
MSEDNSHLRDKPPSVVEEPKFVHGLASGFMASPGKVEGPSPMAVGNSRFASASMAGGYTIHSQRLFVVFARIESGSGNRSGPATFHAGLDMERFELPLEAITP